MIIPMDIVKKKPAPSGVPIHGRRRRFKSLPLGEIIPAISKPIFQKKGFDVAKMILDWRLIVGDEFVACCLPEKLVFSKNSHTRQDGVLTLQVSRGAAAEIQHLIPVLLERVNSYFRYRAVERIVIKQSFVTPKPLKPRLPEPQLSAAEEQSVNSLTVDIQDEALREVLSSLGQWILKKNKRRPT